MKKYLIIPVLLCTLSAAGQNVELSDNQLNANLLPLGFSYERKIDDNKSFTFSGAIAPTGYYETGGVEDKAYFFLTPYFTSTIRNYYSRKSIRKSNLRNNSGNYVALFYSQSLTPFGSTTDFDEINARNQVTNVFVVGPVWGIQRNYASGIHLGLSMGLGITGGEYIDTDVEFTGEFQLGFTLFSK